MNDIAELRTLWQAAVDVDDPVNKAEFLSQFLRASGALLTEIEQLRKVRDAARLKRNVLWSEEDRANAYSTFKGEWVVIPREDFDNLRAALTASEEGTK